MHCFFSNGIVEVELVLLFKACASLGIQQKHIRQFCQADWKHSSDARNVSSFFSDSNEAFESFKGNASDLMTVLPLLEYFATKVLAGSIELAKESASFSQL